MIEALSGKVKLASSLALSSNDSEPYATKTTYLIADAGATLVLSGEITSIIPGDSSEVLDAASGHIVLSHANEDFGGTTQIYAATLEIAANDAAGTGGLRFVGGAGHPATLQIDPGLTFDNLIAGFGTGDTIDLAGFSSNRVALAFTPTDSGTMLTVTNGKGQTMALDFADTGLSAASVSIASDGHGGLALGRV